MAENAMSPLGGDKMKKAVRAFAEMVQQFPEKSRAQLLQEIELRFDLSPAECEFLDKYFADAK